MKTHAITKVVMLSLLLGVSACSNDLSRGRAEALIVKAYNLPQPETLKLNKRYLKRSPGSALGSFGQVCVMLGADNYSDKKGMLDDLEAKHLITVGESTTTEDKCTYLWASVVLTDEGKKYLLGEIGGQYIVRTCEIVFGEVNGIQAHEQSKVAVADYTLKRTNVTPFGKNISQAPFRQQATFSLFDDGWRINSSQQ